MGPNLVSPLSAMVCNDCRWRLQNPRSSAPQERLALLEHGAQLRALICPGCGALLPHADAFDIIVRKLAQLSRFGLAPDSGPLLKTAHDDS